MPSITPNIERAPNIIVALKAPLMIRNSPINEFRPGKPLAASVNMVKKTTYIGTDLESPP